MICGLCREGEKIGERKLDLKFREAADLIRFFDSRVGWPCANQV